MAGQDEQDCTVGNGPSASGRAGGRRVRDLQEGQRPEALAVYLCVGEWMGWIAAVTVLGCSGVLRNSWAALKSTTPARAGGPCADVRSTQSQPTQPGRRCSTRRGRLRGPRPCARCSVIAARTQVGRGQRRLPVGHAIRRWEPRSPRSPRAPVCGGFPRSLPHSLQEAQ